MGVFKELDERLVIREAIGCGLNVSVPANTTNDQSVAREPGWALVKQMNKFHTHAHRIINDLPAAWMSHASVKLYPFTWLCMTLLANGADSLRLLAGLNERHKLGVEIVGDHLSTPLLQRLDGILYLCKPCENEHHSG